MNPRNLRHRLEKASKLLVIVQRYTPEVTCIITAEKGPNGHLVLDFSESNGSQDKMNHLGQALEGRGYTFTEKRSAWLGQITYTGRTDDKPTIVMTLPSQQDRLAISEPSTANVFSFNRKSP